MDIQNYNCKKCGLTIASKCSKCDRTVDVTKCGDCANIPVIKDVCSQQE